MFCLGLRSLGTLLRSAGFVDGDDLAFPGLAALLVAEGGLNEPHCWCILPGALKTKRERCAISHAPIVQWIEQVPPKD